MSRNHLLAAAAFACVIGAPAAASAQVTGGYPPGTPVSEIEARERAETQRLNNAVLERDAQVVAANAAEAERFSRETADYEAAQRAHADAQARHLAEVEAANAARARYEAEMAAWRAAVARPY